MNWMPYLVFALVLVLVLIYRSSSQIAVRKARALLGQGARVIDVRTPGEFASGHLQQAESMPLEQLARLAHERLPDKDATLLLHCQSGVRSGLARQRLRTMGYTQVYNLGSLSRARRIVDQE